MIRRSNLQGAVLAPTEATAWLNQVDWVERVATIIALISTSSWVPTVRTCSLDVAVRQKTRIRRTIGRLHGIFEDISLIVQCEKKILRYTIVIFGSRLSI